MYRSKEILGRPEWSFNRSVFKSIGYSDDDLKRPLIGIANSWNELVPGHYNLRQMAEAVKKEYIGRAAQPVNSASSPAVTVRPKGTPACTIFCPPVI